MAISDRQLLDSLSRIPFIDSVELALNLGEPHSTAHRHLTGLRADGVVGRVSHGTAHLPSSQRYRLTSRGRSMIASRNLRHASSAALSSRSQLHEGFLDSRAL